MTEEEARRWLESNGWWEGVAGARLREFIVLLIAESEKQNLISAGTRPHMWARHVVDSAQLLPLASGTGLVNGEWVDLGTGAGFPGLVIACLSDRPIRLIEARPLRAGFLRRCVEALKLDHVSVILDRVERFVPASPAAIISARAYAPLDRLLSGAIHLSDENTVWLLPKGRQVEKELEMARRDWQAVFHVEQSLSDPESHILTIRSLSRRQSGRAGCAPRARRAARTSAQRRPGR